jgi:glycine/D-amino acid oxidase-like deaminating enzyme
MPTRRFYRNVLQLESESSRRSKMPTRFDAIVIGTGQSGPSLAHRLTGAGQKVAVIERKRFGGTCVNNGCIPTKALIASASRAAPPISAWSSKAPSAST